MSKVAFFIALCASCFSTVLSYGNEARLTHTLYIDSETYQEFSYDELVDCLRNFCLRRDGFGDEYAYQWLKLMKIDRKTIHRALIQVYGDMDKIIKSPDSNKGHCQFAEVGKNRILMFMSFCADENDKEWLNGVYADKGETNEIRANAFFVLLMMSGRDDVTSLILSVANFIDQPAKIRSFMYSGIKAAANWAPVEKRTAMVAALKDVAMLENSKFMFVALDDIF